MKWKVVIPILAVFVALIFQPGRAWAGAGVENPYGIDPKAPGQRYSGPVTVYFEYVPVLDKKGTFLYWNPDIYHLYFFARLDSGKALRFYSYDAGEVSKDFDSLLSAFHAFIEAKFIPDVCQTSPCPSFSDGRVNLKSLTNNFYDLGFPPAYFIADVVIAVNQ